MTITLITVGKLKENYLKQAIKEYTKRLSRYCTLQIIEVPDEKTPDKPSHKEEEHIKEKEGNVILRKVKDTMYCIALDLNGQMLSSEDFSEKIKELQVSGKSKIAFVIGGSLGLSKQVLTRADTRISFSKMTFPHQLFRVMVLEQVYRGFRIIHGEPYHK